MSDDTKQFAILIGGGVLVIIALLTTCSIETHHKYTVCEKAGGAIVGETCKSLKKGDGNE